MRLRTGGGGDAAAGADPLLGAFCVWVWGVVYPGGFYQYDARPMTSNPWFWVIRTIRNAQPPTHERPVTLQAIALVFLVLSFPIFLPALFILCPPFRLRVQPRCSSRFLRQPPLMLHDLLPRAPLPHKTARRRENHHPPLPCLHRPRNEALPIAHALDVVEDRDRGVAGEDEIAVHAVDQELGIGGRWDGALRGAETLGYDGAAVDAARVAGVPEFAGVGEDVLGGGVGGGVVRRGERTYGTDICEGGEAEECWGGHGVLIERNGGLERCVERWGIIL